MDNSLLVKMLDQTIDQYGPYKRFLRYDRDSTLWKTFGNHSWETIVFGPSLVGKFAFSITRNQKMGCGNIDVQFTDLHIVGQSLT